MPIFDLPFLIYMPDVLFLLFRRLTRFIEVTMPVALVTGSSTGIGLATARELAGRGYLLMLHAKRSLGRLQAAAAEIPRLMGDSTCVRCMTADLSEPRACQDLVTAAFAWKGRIDVWVNNAGVDVLTTEMRHASFEDKLLNLMAVDLLGTIRLSRAVAQRMLHQSAGDTLPSIINVGWDQANLGMEGEAGQMFCPVKAGVMAFTTSLAMTLGPQIRVNCVAPGWIRTAWGEAAASNYWEHRAEQECLLKRWGRPEEVAQTIGWLASEQAAFVNGQILPINGGRRYHPHSSL